MPTKRAKRPAAAPREAPHKFEVVEDPVNGYRVVDARTGANVDGPFRDLEDAVARAAKRETRDL